MDYTGVILTIVFAIIIVSGFLFSIKLLGPPESWKKKH